MNAAAGLAVAATLAMLGAAPSAQAQLAGQGTAAPGEAFASGCAGLVFGYTPVYAGNVVAGGVSVPGTPCETSGPRSLPAVQVQPSTPGVSNGVAFQAGVAAEAKAGIIGLAGRVQASTRTNFAGGIVQAGWNDRFTLSAPGQSGQGLWVVPIATSGQLQVGGVGGLAYVDLMAFRNHQPITANGSALFTDAMAQFGMFQPAHQGILHGSWDDQMVEWAVGDAGPGLPNTRDSLTIAGTVRFVVPFTWDQPLDLGIWAMGSVGQSSSTGPVPVGDTADIAAGTGFHWAGPGVVLAGGQTISQFSLSAASGLDYGQAIPPAVPEPGGAAMLIAGLIGVGLLTRVRRARSGHRDAPKAAARTGPALASAAIVAALAAVGAPAAQAQAPNLVVDGSFEQWPWLDSRNISDPQFPDVGYLGYAWAGVMRTEFANQLGFGPAPDGQKVGVWKPFFPIQPQPGDFRASQRLATTAGHSYWLSYRLATSAPVAPAGESGNLLHHVVASFGGVPVDFGEQVNQGFTRYGRQVDAHAATTTLKFQDRPRYDVFAAYGDHRNVVALDAVSVTDVSLDPHPGAGASPHSWALGAGHTDHVYQLVVAPQGLTWTEAATRAAAMGGTLAQGASPEALDFLATVASDDGRAWQPRDLGPTQGPWLALHQQLNFDPDSVDFSRRERASDALAQGFIVEFATAPVPEPGTAALWLGGLAAVLLGARRRRAGPGRAKAGDAAAGAANGSSTWTTLAAALAAAMPAAPAHADVTWSSGAGANGHTYRLVSVTPGLTWDAAEAAAVAAGGHLATIASAAENAFVFNLANQHASAWFTDTAGHARGPWLGGFQPPGSAEPAGGWQWVGGDGALVYTAWAPGQPNNSGSNESRLQFYSLTATFASQWNDASPTAVGLGYVVEFAPAVPEPASAALALGGLAALAWHRRRTTRAWVPAGR